MKSTFHRGGSIQESTFSASNLPGHPINLHNQARWPGSLLI